MIKTILVKIYAKIISAKFRISPSRMLTNSFLRDYKKRELKLSKIHHAHKLGYSVNDYRILGINDENYGKYLSTVQYLSMHPLNGSYSKWIDDKLTLKYLCAGTELDKYMPEYYYQIDETGRIYQLVDCPYKSAQACIGDLSKLLKEKKVLAIKKIAGAIGEGFIKGEYIDGQYYLNGKQLDVTSLEHSLSKLKNYIITEYLYPHRELAEYCPRTCNCIRYLIGRTDGKMQMLKSFIRFGTKKSGFVENYNAGGVLCYISERGEFSTGNVIDFVTKTNRVITAHPDSEKQISGKIPLWGEIVEAASRLGQHFPQMKYLGIDFVVTNDNRVKILEVNSLTSLDSIQLDCSIFDSSAGEFYKQFIR